MKKIFLILLLIIITIPSFSQGLDDNLFNRISKIQISQGDSIARLYLKMRKDSIEQIGESINYYILWGSLTSSMWHDCPKESTEREYKHFLKDYIDDIINTKTNVSLCDPLTPLCQLVSDYLKFLYEEEDKETALSFLKSLQSWSESYNENRKTTIYAHSLLNLCNVLIKDMHQYDVVEHFCREYERVANNVYGNKSSEYAIAIYNISILPQTKTEEKIDLLQKAITIYEQMNKKDDSIYRQVKLAYEQQIGEISGVVNTEIIDSNKIESFEECALLVISGRGRLAINSLLEFKKVYCEELYIDTLKYSNTINLLIQAYVQTGDWAAAQKELTEFDEYIGIYKLPAEILQTFYSNAGVIAIRLKNYEKALQYCQLSCNLLEKRGDYGIEYAKILSNIAIVYAEAGQFLGKEYYLDAKWFIDEAISIFEERIGPLSEHGNVGIMLLNNKAFVYNALGNEEEAISSLETIVNNFSEINEIKEAWLSAVCNLSFMYMRKSRWSEAANLLDGIKSDNLETNYTIAQNLALCHLYLKDTSKAVEALIEMNRLSILNIQNIFSIFSGVERENYWSHVSKELVFANNLIANHTNNAQAISVAYNNTLFCKNLLINSSRLLEKIVSLSTDINLKQKYNEYKSLKGTLAYKTTDEHIKDSLANEISIIERSILKSAGNFGQWLNRETKSWENVRESLEEGEIAIEFCYAPRMDIIPEVQLFYGAFVLRKDYEYPIFISLEKEDLIDKIFDNQNSDILFINEFYSSESVVKLTNMIWEKLIPYLNDIKTIYYSPTGHLTNINFDVLCGEDGILLGDKYSMIRISSTANIGEIKQYKLIKYKSSVLYGNIKYDELPQDMKDASTFYTTFTGTEIMEKLEMRSESERGRWGEIPYSKQEIENISKTLSKKGVKVSIFEKEKANEESFKNLSGKSPEILHLATHGFYIGAPQVEKNQHSFVASTSVYSQKDSYMMWAGLMLAGGNNKWLGKFDLTNVEDGILTADEISQMDLSDTKLVVLSACETAKGKMDPVDGIYGLQRAFKIAGVRTIIMSLWKVQDEATYDLMTHFYTYLSNGIERHEALWKAMMIIKEKYKDPYYWASFIMLD